MSIPYYPSSTKECFEYSAIAHYHGILSSEEYLDRMLAHLSGMRHSEDNSVMNLQDPLSMVLHTCAKQLAEVIIEDTSSIKKLLLDAWIGRVEDMTTQAPYVLGSLEAYGISTNIYEGLLCIACLTGKIQLLSYFLTINEYLVRLAGSTLQPLQAAIRKTKPDVAIWTVLLDKGLYLSRGTYDPTWSLSAPEDSKLLVTFWANKSLSNSLPAVELISFLFTRGFVVTADFLRSAVSKMNSDFVRWVLTKCDPNLITGTLLISAARNSPQVVDILLDTGIDVNFSTGPSKDNDPFHPIPGTITALHVAADTRNADVVRLLLERGANKFARNTWGQNAEDIATQQLPGPYTEIVDLIKNFVPGSERYVVPPEDISRGQAVNGQAEGWKFIERKLGPGPLIDISEL
ncbi:hypothetical protein OIDMADRAFT_31525 [Oidiodendron maius Zn]|uniref:Uncharacterized protein n=1 Tax=Oidiodendron maius (strain Zn) TaxID=913774 RepID=A0A0C3CIF5_OIDMZ|nr:hypothetical protein OIDMADRAFT_31525 [Oidiodendron maius Zn]